MVFRKQYTRFVACSNEMFGVKSILLQALKIIGKSDFTEVKEHRKFWIWWNYEKVAQYEISNRLEI